MYVACNVYNIFSINKHQDSESRNVHKLAACSSEHAVRQDYIMQLS